ncbi:hypothetical protein RKD51_000692 [Bacillus sp. SLBN-57]
MIFCPHQKRFYFFDGQSHFFGLQHKGSPFVDIRPGQLSVSIKRPFFLFLLEAMCELKQFFLVHPGLHGLYKMGSPLIFLLSPAIKDHFGIKQFL